MLKDLLYAVALQAAPTPAVATINGWTIFDNQGTCSAITEFDHSVWVSINYDFGTNIAIFVVANPAWESVEAGRSYPVTLHFTNGTEYPDTQARGLRVDGADGRITGIALRLNGRDFLRDFAGSATGGLFMGEVRLEVLSLRGTRAMVERLRACSVASWRRHPNDPFSGLSRRNSTTEDAPVRVVPPQRARANLSSYFSGDDYPAAALRGNDEGSTGFRLTIGPNGRVTDCQVTSSSGSPALDQATCRILRSRARYTPARDSSGNPTSGTDSGRITWRVPETGPSATTNLDSVASVVAGLPPPSRIWVQVGTGERAGLAFTLRTMRERAPALLGSRTAYIAPIQATNRLLVGPFARESEAQAFVNRLGSSGVPGFVWTSAYGEEVEQLEQ